MKILVYYNNNDDEKRLIKEYCDKNYNDHKLILIDNQHPKLSSDKNTIYLKSMYQIDHGKKNYNDKSWIFPGKLIGLQAKTKSVQQESAQVFTPARVGTVFFEQVLKLYYKKVHGHFCFAPDGDWSKDEEHVIFCNQLNNQSDIYHLNGKCTDIYIMYRIDWLSYLASNSVATMAGYHHEDEFDYSNVKILKKDYKKLIIEISKRINLYFNTVCNFIIANPKTSIKLVVFEDILEQYKDKVKHKKINYGLGKSKEDLFEDWNYFIKICNKVIPSLEMTRKNWLDKLQQLGIEKTENLAKDNKIVRLDRNKKK
jgi:hypothetical protein|tara:strand:+ start:273 stop:1208 length:936 start_codon:yes stop_codon:yes gene_type:complete